LKKEDSLVYFLIVNFNGSEILHQCLQSVSNQKQCRTGILVVDNGSTDQSLHIIRQYAPKVMLLELDTNQGYAKASNLGLSQILRTEAQYIALINTDVILSPNWTQEMTQFMVRQRCDLAQSIITTYRCNQVVDSLGIGISRHFKIYDRGRGKPLQNAQTASSTIFGPCFAAALFRREVVEQLRIGDSFLDETFISFYEDVDCCFRAVSSGFRAGLLSKPLCDHRRSFTADRNLSQKYYLIGRNYWILIQKHVPLKWIIKKIPHILSQHFWFWLRSGRSATQLVTFATGSVLGLMRLLQSILSLDSAPQREHSHPEDVIRRILEGYYE
jgi:GT2 family glycosyltransferase